MPALKNGVLALQGLALEDKELIMKRGQWMGQNLQLKPLINE